MAAGRPTPQNETRFMRNCRTGRSGGVVQWQVGTSTGVHSAVSYRAATPPPALSQFRQQASCAHPVGLFACPNHDAGEHCTWAAEGGGGNDIGL